MPMNILADSNHFRECCWSFVMQFILQVALLQLRRSILKQRRSIGRILRSLSDVSAEAVCQCHHRIYVVRFDFSSRRHSSVVVCSEDALHGSFALLRGFESAFIAINLVQQSFSGVVVHPRSFCVWHGGSLLSWLMDLVAGSCQISKTGEEG